LVISVSHSASTHLHSLHSTPTRRSSDLLVLAGIGVLLLMATLVIFTETQAPHRRTGVGAGTTLHNFVHLLGDRPFLCLVLVMGRSEEHTSELQSRFDLVCRLLLEKQKKT